MMKVGILEWGNKKLTLECVLIGRRRREADSRDENEMVMIRDGPWVIPEDDTETMGGDAER